MKKPTQYAKELVVTKRGMLHLPEGTERKPPVVAILHEFGCDRNVSSYSLTRLSHKLAKKDIASIRFDFLCNGESDGGFVDMTISGEIADACVIVGFVKGLEEVDIPVLQCSD